MTIIYGKIYDNLQPLSGSLIIHNLPGIHNTKAEYFNVRHSLFQLEPIKRFLITDDLALDTGLHGISSKVF